VEAYFGSWRGVTVDSFFMSIRNDLRTVQKKHNNNGHNALQAMSDHTGIASALQKGSELKHFCLKK